jgi:hypothetical protein
LNEEGKMKDMTGQRRSLRRGSINDEKDEKKEYVTEKGWGERNEETHRSETDM